MPLSYSEENPALMVALASLGGQFLVGGIVTYELKRRQWSTEQLEKQFGE